MQKGFSLIEILLSLAIISILVAISAPVYLSFQNKNDMNIAETSVAQTLRRAQVLARSMASDSDWGVYIQDNKVTLFQGTSYLVRNSNFDEIFNTPKTLSVSGLNEIVFEKFTGDTINVGDIILISNNNDTKTITINQKGMLAY